MSNFLAIATVTACISQLIQAAIEVDVQGSQVTTFRPDEAVNGAAGSRVNVFLYQATTNPALRNMDMPGRRSNGSLLTLPKVPLDLHYLFTFYGDEPTLVPERLLGSVIRTLHAEPQLTRQRIRDTISGGTYPFLAESNLADDIELVKFTPIPLSLEELSKLWSVMLQTPYVLSIIYQATVVVIEGETPPQPALPVKESKLFVGPFASPTISELYTLTAPGQPPLANQPIVSGTTLVLLGQQLRTPDASTTTLVRIDGTDVTLDPQSMRPTRIDIALPPTVRAGIRGIQVIRQMNIGNPPTPHTGIESNIVAFVLRPMITAIETNNVLDDGSGLFTADVTIHANPTIGGQQRATLLLNETQNATNPVSYAFPMPPSGADSDTITFSIKGVKAATYLVRIQVDGAENVQDADPAKSSLTIP